MDRHAACEQLSSPRLIVVHVADCNPRDVVRRRRRWSSRAPRRLARDPASPDVLDVGKNRRYKRWSADERCLTNPGVYQHPAAGGLQAAHPGTGFAQFAAPWPRRDRDYFGSAPPSQGSAGQIGGLCPLSPDRQGGRPATIRFGHRVFLLDYPSATAARRRVFDVGSFRAAPGG